MKAKKSPSSGQAASGKARFWTSLAPLNGTVVRADSMDRHGVQKLYQDPPAAFPRHVELGQSLRDIAKLHNMPWD